MKIKIYFLVTSFVLCLFSGFIWPTRALALTPGTLVYRTSSEGKMYGYSGDPLIFVDENKVLKQIYPGHVGIYIGKENGEDYIVEALAGGIVKTPAKYFVNEALGEKFLGAKIPIAATDIEIAKAVKIAKNLVGKKLGYDFDFKKQKGPGDGDWTCVGLTEKIYESAGISNPNNLGSLEYNSDYYAVDITPDGFDNRSLENDEGDCFSKTLEFSKIERKIDTRLPLPEAVGFNAGLEYQGERYIFLPYTQFLQTSLQDKEVDINLKTFFIDDSIRGKTSSVALLLRWSLINNPISSLKIVANKTISAISSLKDKIFGSRNETKIVLEDNIKLSDSSSSSNLENSSQLHLPIIKINQTDIPKETEIKDDKLSAQKLAVKPTIESKINEVLVPKIKINEVFVPTIKIAAASTAKIAPTSSNSEIVKTISSSSKSSIASLTGASVKAVASKLVSAVKITETASSGNLTKPTSVISKITAGSKPNIIQTTSTVNTPSTENSSSFNNHAALINKIYSTENNDFIELYNPTDYDFDLAEAGFRLEKAKTAADPSLMMRIGNASDGSYPGGTVIKAKGYYLIVRDDANSYYKNKADAVAIRNEFSWTDSGYIIYLGKAAISSTTDEDTVDAVGFGEATYFQGSGPALAINDNYILNRLKATGNNNSDFNLIISDDPGIIWNEENNDDNNDNNNNNNNNNDNSNDGNNNQGNNDGNSNNPDLFTDVAPIVSSGISDLWHFSECYGEQNYTIGRFDCGIKTGFINPVFSKQLTSTVDLNKFSVSFYYRSQKLAYLPSRLIFKLKNESGRELKIGLEEGMLEVQGLPNAAERYYDQPIFPDTNWHQFSLVVDRSAGYWTIYFDGKEAYKQLFVQTLVDNFSSLEFSGDMGPALLDELVFWDRPITSSEIAANFSAAAPFSPIASRVAQKEAELKYFWNFNEGHELANEAGGLRAIDEIKNLKLNLPENSWVWRGTENTGIINKWGNNLGVDLPTVLNSKDLSLAFWWRSELSSLEGRSFVSLQHNNEAKMGLAPDLYRRNFLFNNISESFSEGNDVDIPYDNKWHHLALTYDSYRYLLKFYVDGLEKKAVPAFWIQDGKEPNRLEIKNELNSVELDDLGIWEGALTSSEVKQIYQDSKIN